VRKQPHASAGLRGGREQGGEETRERNNFCARARVAVSHACWRGARNCGARTGMVRGRFPVAEARENVPEEKPRRKGDKVRTAERAERDEAGMGEDGSGGLRGAAAAALSAPSPRRRGVVPAQ